MESVIGYIVPFPMRSKTTMTNKIITMIRLIVSTWYLCEKIYKKYYFSDKRSNYLNVLYMKLILHAIFLFIHGINFKFIY